MVIYKSSFPSIAIPNTDIYSFITAPNESNQNNDLDKPLFIDGETSNYLTWNQINKASAHLASGWKENVGLKEGDTVTIFAPNQLDHAVLYFSLLAADCTISPG